MDNQFIPQAVDIVKQAIQADNAGDYEKALPLYKRALEYFMTGLKYEKNPAARDTIKAVLLSIMSIPVIARISLYFS